jgi:hypothetical protein
VWFKDGPPFSRVIQALENPVLRGFKVSGDELIECEDGL